MGLFQALTDPEYYKEVANVAKGYGKTALGRLLRGEALLTGEPIVNALARQMKADPTQTAMDWAAPGVGHLGGMVAHTAWHGSPHIFDKFDLAKIGTGEGAQAYGHGMYLAESPEVADMYKRVLSQTENMVDGEILDTFKPRHMLAKTLSEESGNIENARESLNMMTRPGGSKSVANSAKEALKLLDAGERPTIQSIKAEGSLYKTDIPDEHIAKMLDWDKPLSEQSKEIQDFALQNAKLLKKQVQFFQANPHNAEFAPKTIYDLTGSELLSALGRGGAAEAKLAEAGIPGIKYLDAGSRGGVEGTRNFVIFNPEDIRILERNAVPTGQVPWPKKTPAERLASPPQSRFDVPMR